MRLPLSAFALDDPIESFDLPGDLDGCSPYLGSISTSPAGSSFVHRGTSTGSSFTLSSFLDSSFLRRHRFMHHAGYHYPMSPKLHSHSHSRWRHAEHHDHHHEGQIHGHPQHFPMKRHLRHPLQRHRQFHGHFQHRLPSRREGYSLHIPHHALAKAGFIENTSWQAGVDMPPHQQERHAQSPEASSFAMDESCLQRKAELKKQIFVMSSKIASLVAQQKKVTRAVNSLQDVPDTNEMRTNQKRRVDIDKLLGEQAKALQKSAGLRQEKLDLINELRKLKCEVADLPPEDGAPFECPPCDPLPEPREREPMVSAEDDPHWTHVNQVVAPVHAQHGSMESWQKPALIGEPVGLANSFPDYGAHEDSMTPQEQVVSWIVTSLLPPPVQPDRSSGRTSQERRLATALCFL